MKTYSWSLIAFVSLSIWLVGFRSMNIDKSEISWDVFGYYLPLQASFIEGDPMLHEREWVEELNEKENVSGTLYQITASEDGAPMYFFLFGMSYMYSIFFGIGHLLAGWLGYAQDGLSAPYQYALVYGCILYTLIGLHYFRKVLRLYFDDKIVAFLLVVLVLGTNYSHHMTLKNLETVNVLFMFTAIILWNTIQWYERQQRKNIIVIGVSICMMALIKPSEILIVFVPILWGLRSISEVLPRFKLFWKHKSQFILTVSLCLLIAAPQMAYWYLKTGSIIYDTYNNPGVGLDIFSPHILESLFSYRKGWLVYTPLMIFALIGYYFLYKKNKSLFIGLLVPFIISFYIIASWTEYWYGAGFSNRPVISLYPLLFIPFGYFLSWMVEQRKWVMYSFASATIFLIFINQFQWWQLRIGILDPYRTTKEYYWKTFLATSVTEKDKELLLVSRDFSGNSTFDKSDNYFGTTIVEKSIVKVEDENKSFAEFAFENKIAYKELTDRDHCWVEYSFDYFIKDSLSEQMFCSMMHRRNGDYGAKYYDLPSSHGKWNSFSVHYLTPEIRNVNDELKCFFWNRTHSSFEVKNFKIKVYQKK